MFVVGYIFVDHSALLAKQAALEVFAGAPPASGWKKVPRADISALAFFGPGARLCFGALSAGGKGGTKGDQEPLIVTRSRQMVRYCLTSPDVSWCPSNGTIGQLPMVIEAATSRLAVAAPGQARLPDADARENGRADFLEETDEVMRQEQSPADTPLEQWMKVGENMVLQLMIVMGGLFLSMFILCWGR